MECIISIIAAVTTFVMNIIDFLDKHDGSIMCFLTFGIMIFAVVTAYIANQKRKDDLFKIRWKFYQNIIEFIRNIDFHLDGLIYSYSLEKNEKIARDSVEYVIREYQADNNLDDDEIKEIVSTKCPMVLKNLNISYDLQIMLALYDTIQGDVSFHYFFKENEVYLKPKGFIQKSKYLFGNDVSEFLKQFLSIDTIEERYQKHYLDIMKKFGLDNNFLKKTIEVHGWSVNEDPLIRDLHNGISSINKIDNTRLETFKKDNKESWDNLNKVLSFLKKKDITFRTAAGFIGSTDFKELEEKFDKYLKLDNQFLKRFFRWKK